MGNKKKKKVDTEEKVEKSEPEQPIIPDTIIEEGIEEIKVPGQLKYAAPSMSPHKRKKLFGNPNK